MRDTITTLIKKHKDNKDKVEVLIEFIKLNWSEHTRAEFWPELFEVPEGEDNTLKEVQKELFG